MRPRLELIDGHALAYRMFFALPLEQRQGIDKRRSPHFRGWEQLGSELTNNEIDYREQLDIGVEAEQMGLLGYGSSLIYTNSTNTVPMITTKKHRAEMNMIMPPRAAIPSAQCQRSRMLPSWKFSA